MGGIGHNIVSIQSAKRLRADTHMDIYETIAMSTFWGVFFLSCELWCSIALMVVQPGGKKCPTVENQDNIATKVTINRPIVTAGVASKSTLGSNSRGVKCFLLNNPFLPVLIPKAFWVTATVAVTLWEGSQKNSLNAVMSRMREVADHATQCTCVCLCVLIYI